MLIPIRCFTCGKPIAGKYQYYLQKVREKKLENGTEIDKVNYITNENIQHFKKTPEGEIMDELKLTALCCRRHFLTHVNIPLV